MMVMINCYYVYHDSAKILSLMRMVYYFHIHLISKFSVRYLINVEIYLQGINVSQYYNGLILNCEATWENIVLSLIENSTFYMIFW